MKIHVLRITNFRGFASVTIKPAGHVLAIGEPRAGRSDLVEALTRVFSPEATRLPLTDDLDFFGRDRTKRVEVEVTLGDLGEELTQRFFDRLEFWDAEEGGLLDEVDEPEGLDRGNFKPVVRLCYRAVWSDTRRVTEPSRSAREIEATRLVSSRSHIPERRARAIKSTPWPGNATLEIAKVWSPCSATTTRRSRRGEGIFLRLDEARVAAWVQAVAGGDQLEGLRQAHRRWRRNRGFADVSYGWPGERYVLLHSLSHALIHELALECGYSAASVRERLYARDPRDGGEGAMAGILLYTSAPDAEGTLGGLVALADPDEFSRLLDAALRRVALCSADPMCAGHAPTDAETTLHNAACHACLFLPETSCERANRYLDRSVLTATVAGRGVEFAFRV